MFNNKKQTEKTQDDAASKPSETALCACCGPALFQDKSILGEVAKKTQSDPFCECCFKPDSANSSDIVSFS